MPYGNKKSGKGYQAATKKTTSKAGQKTSQVGQRQSYKQTGKAPGNGRKS